MESCTLEGGSRNRSSDTLHQNFDMASSDPSSASKEDLAILTDNELNELAKKMGISCTADSSRVATVKSLREAGIDKHYHYQDLKKASGLDRSPQLNPPVGKLETAGEKGPPGVEGKDGQKGGRGDQGQDKGEPGVAHKMSNTTSQKFTAFIDTPMGNKSVIDLPGVGPVSGVRLAAAGFDRADMVFAHFLILGKDEVKFLQWMKNVGRAFDINAKECFQAVHGWHNKYMSA